VFSRAEPSIAGLCREHDALAITDEITSTSCSTGRARRDRHAARDGRAHDHDQRPSRPERHRLAHRLGFGEPELTLAIRKVHDFLTVGAPAPLQEAAAEAPAFGTDYFAGLARDVARRAVMLDVLAELGFASTARAALTT
jgi:aminotransferase